MAQRFSNFIEGQLTFAAGNDQELGESGRGNEGCKSRMKVVELLELVVGHTVISTLGDRK